jgi:hypothetical protein
MLLRLCVVKRLSLTKPQLKLALPKYFHTPHLEVLRFVCYSPCTSISLTQQGAHHDH